LNTSEIPDILFGAKERVSTAIGGGVFQVCCLPGCIDVMILKPALANELKRPIS
jgi:hypothetical protein